MDCHCKMTAMTAVEHCLATVTLRRQMGQKEKKKGKPTAAQPDERDTKRKTGQKLAEPKHKSSAAKAKR